MSTATNNVGVSFKAFAFIPKGSDKKYTTDSKVRLNRCIREYVDEGERNYFKNTLVKELTPLKTEVTVNFNNDKVSVKLPDRDEFTFDNSRYAEQLKKDKSVLRYPTDQGYFDFKYRTINAAKSAKWDYNCFANYSDTKSLGKLMVAKDIAKFYG